MAKRAFMLYVSSTEVQATITIVRLRPIVRAREPRILKTRDYDGKLPSAPSIYRGAAEGAAAACQAAEAGVGLGVYRSTDEGWSFESESLNVCVFRLTQEALKRKTLRMLPQSTLSESICFLICSLSWTLVCPTGGWALGTAWLGLAWLDSRSFVKGHYRTLYSRKIWPKPQTQSQGLNWTCSTAFTEYQVVNTELNDTEPSEAKPSQAVPKKEETQSQAKTTGPRNEAKPRKARRGKLSGAQHNTQTSLYLICLRFTPYTILHRKAQMRK